jgi:precorrin-2 dehydrogenase/sirohydrochlorin ferrochelatase
VSTSGISPALSRFIRKELEILYGPEFSEYLKSLRSVRSEAMRRIRDQRERNKFLKSVASEKIVRMLREKGCKEAKSMVKNLLKNSKTYLTGKKNN